MTIRKVLRAGHPDLRTPSEPVSEDWIGSEEFDRVLRDMFETMEDQDGVGLAAPQVQEHRRMLVYRIQSNPRYEQVEEEVGPTVLINPDVIEVSEQRDVDWEGCLSLPKLRGRVPRHHWLRVQALDRQGTVLEKRAEGFEARVIQHEIDHLDGRLYVDRMESMESLSFLEEHRRYHAQSTDETETNP